MKYFLRNLLVLIVIISLTSCSTLDSNKKAIIGGLAGAAIGAAIGKNTGHGKYNQAIGALLGLGLGYAIGHTLDERDKRALEEKIIEALNTAEINQTVVWRSDHTDAEAEITPVEESIRTEKVAVHPASGSRVTTEDLNLRKGPGMSSDVVKVILKGTKVSIVGITDNGWCKIKKSGSIEGFVYERYLCEESEYVSTNKQQEQRRITPITKQEISYNPEQSTEELTEIVRLKCRSVRVREKINGKIIENHVNTCQDSNGSWGV